MIDFARLIKGTNAYKIFCADKLAGRLSHAYLILCADGYIREYLKEFAKVIVLDKDETSNIRLENLIDEENHPDVITYPEKDKDSVLTQDVADLIEKSYIKPLESDKKIFLIANAETMNASSQNKLLKTLEEPPENVVIILGAKSEFALLPTIKSRVKKLEIAQFLDEDIIKALNGECEDINKLKSAVSSGDGTVMTALNLYSDENLTELKDLVCDMIVNMKSSREVLRYSVKFSLIKEDFSAILSVMEMIFADMLVGKIDKNLVKDKISFGKVEFAEGYERGAIIYALDKINEASKRRKFNANDKILLEWLLFSILEGKFKWRK